jgi:hypothetical protein
VKEGSEAASARWALSPQKEARLTASRVLSGEYATFAKLTAAYCRAHHGSKDGLCEECTDFIAYVRRRLACCPYGGGKPVCGKCRIHCYAPEYREKARRIMRWGGPRSLWIDPAGALRHLWRSVTVKPPEKPRNRGGSRSSTERN